MFRPINFGLVRSISLSVILLLNVSALGQFEVAPDHFDSSSKKEAVRHATVKSRAKNLPAASAQPAARRNAGTLQVAARRKQSATTTRIQASTRRIHPRTTAALAPR